MKTWHLIINAKNINALANDIDQRKIHQMNAFIVITELDIMNQKQ
jgi:hypothetical protein